MRKEKEYMQLDQFKIWNNHAKEQWSNPTIQEENINITENSNKPGNDRSGGHTKS